MLSVPPGRCVWLCVQPTDMRCSFDGLSAVVRQHLGEDPSSGQWFAFINRGRTRIKILAFEECGYCVWSKRLEVDPAVQGNLLAALGVAAPPAKELPTETITHERRPKVRDAAINDTGLRFGDDVPREVIAEATPPSKPSPKSGACASARRSPIAWPSARAAT